MRPLPVLLVVALVTGALATFAPPTASGDDIAEVRARAQAATQDLADAEARLGEISEDISTTQHQTDVARQAIGGLRSQVQEIAVQQYIRPTDVYLMGGDLTRLARADALARIVTHGDTDALDAYQGAREDLAAASAHLEALQAEQTEAIADLEARQDDLQAELARLEEVERQRRAAEEAARRQAAALAAAAAAAAADDAPPADTGGSGGGGGGTPPPSGGGITCPVPSATFVDTWGAPRAGHTHQGVDMMAVEGAPVYAPASGNVEHRAVGLGGLSFFLYGDNGDTYFGTHMSGYAGGGHVAAGTLIGYVGQTGNAGTPHLHFEIWPGGGAAVNPYPATAAACL
ncbi:MAG: peptidoglycan DD-metalloendopeptidase family protein [Acidimicrobiales bacterium]